MKYKLSFYLTFVFFILLSSASCRKHKPINPVDQLPPESQTGAGTIGFLADGKPFTANYPKVYATYIFTTQNGYSLGISAGHGTNWALGIITDSLKVNQEIIYYFNNQSVVLISKNSLGGFYYSPDGKGFFTKSSLKGQFYVSHLDTIKQVISGTFWFDAEDTITNDLVHITNGRLDLHYTR